MTTTELKAVLDAHAAWLRGETGGRRADLSRADLSRADLSRADLSRADLSRADLSGADLSGADLRGADLSGADLSGADLSGADLRGADLRGADLSGAKELPAITPLPDLRQRLAAAISVEGCRVAMNDWHTCDTAHCIAGWITTVHPQGRLLESIYSTPTAAWLILSACGVDPKDHPDFYDTAEGGNDRAREWLLAGAAP